MKNSFIERNRKLVNILIAIFIVFSLLSFLIITNIYSKLEKNNRDASISNLIYKIKSQIEYNHKIALEYSSSDEVYEFIENGNKDYIYKNFRQGSYTLEDLDLSYFILIDKKNNIKYSNFTRDINKEESANFSAFILEKLKDINKVNEVIIYNNQAYYIAKSPIYKTDYEDNSNGFLYLGSKIDNNVIKNLSKDFINIKFISNPKASIKKINSNNNEAGPVKIKVKSKIVNNININEISFYDYNSKILFTVKVKKEIHLLNDIKKFTIIIFLCLLIMTILSLLYISNKYTAQVKEQNESIDKIVKNKTSQMKVTIEDLKKTNKHLYEIAHTDYLTKTMNRRNFFIHAQINFTEAKKNNELLCVVMIDIDNFKKFNDKYGHNTGDRVLTLFADKIKQNISEKTILGRLGGEEFALVIKNTNLEDAIKKAEKLKKKIEDIELKVDDKILKITASFGVSDNQNCDNIDEMLQKADKLLYTAKESGRNLVRSRLNFC